jgi:hypothetical protein
MPRNSKSPAPVNKVQGRDPSRIIRPILGVLVVLNLIGAGLVLYPPGGSADSLDRELASMQTQLAQKRALLEQTRQHVEAVKKGRGEGDQFLDGYFLPRRTVSSQLLDKLTDFAKKAQIKERGQTTATELVDGSDSLAMMTISADYEGTYKNLMSFVREIDRSPLLLIVESLNAAPVQGSNAQQGSNTLTVSMKINAFVQGEGQDTPPPAAGEGQ